MTEKDEITFLGPTENESDFADVLKFKRDGGQITVLFDRDHWLQMAGISLNAEQVTALREWLAGDGSSAE